MGDTKKLITYLSQFVSSRKLFRMQEMLDKRTRHLSVLVENIYLSHNASAVLRSCEAFGLQDVHIVEDRSVFKPVDGIAMGSQKWLTIQRYNSIVPAIAQLKKHGYKIIATTPHTHAHMLPELPVEDKTILMFGNEQVGLTQKALEQADDFVKIPMYGFTESFNISVSVAVCVYDMIQRLKNSGIDWKLTEQEQQAILLTWLRNQIDYSEKLETTFLQQ